MKPPLISRCAAHHNDRRSERGVTIALVAVAMVAIIGMAMLSIDVVTLYLADAEAQRTADAAALAAARVISLSGLTADPDNTSGFWANVCGSSTTSSAYQVAQAVAQQNSVAQSFSSTVTVKYSIPGGGLATDCSTLGDAFAVNPEVTVQVQRTGLATFFARYWGNTGSTITATATAEAFNPSGSSTFSASRNIVPVHPRCVKPWIVPNSDPGNGGATFVSLADGSITTPGIRVSGAGTGAVGETFNLVPDCKPGFGRCSNFFNPLPNNPPTANPGAGTLQFVPGQLPASVTGVPSCGDDSVLQEAISGCDQATVYQCGVQLQNTVDLGVRNVSADTTTAGQCLTHYQSAASDQDSLDTSVVPYVIRSGTYNPLSSAGVPVGTPITDSNSIVTVPMYDQTAGRLNTNGTTDVTIVGFLQVFINNVDPVNGVSVTVLNVSGCGNGLTTPVSSTAVSGSSPVPVRLISGP
jgi:hypothetical protein